MKTRLEKSWQAIHFSDEKTNRLVIDLKQSFPVERRCVPNYLLDQAAKYHSRILFSYAGDSLTYEQAPNTAARWGAALTALGVKKGDRIVFLCGNSFTFLEIFLGCAWIGAIAVPINTASRGLQLEHMLDNCGAKIGFIDTALVDALETVDLQAVPVNDIYIVSDEKSESQNKSLKHANIHPLPQCTDTTAAAQLSPEDPLAILYTSGTTGMSKGVLCPHGQFFWWSVLTGQQLALVEGDVLHTTLPLFHINALGCFFQALLFGGTQVVAKRFSVTTFWDELVASNATVTYLLGAMVPMLLSKDVRPEEATHQVRVALAPGVPANFQVPFMERSAIVLFDGFGSTETNAVIGCNAQNYRTDTMGMLKDGIEAMVIDDQGQPIADGIAGELLLRTTEPFCFASGYFGMPEKTEQAWRDTWFHTGDNVVRSEDGYFKFVDRAKDSIRRRGENISSFEVEQVLASHPKISLAAVYAVPSELGEDEVMTSIVFDETSSLSQEEIIRFCEGKMSYFSIPRFVNIVEELPRTESGKIQKYKLRELGKTESTWDREAAGVKIKR